MAPPQNPASQANVTKVIFINFVAIITTIFDNCQRIMPCFSHTLPYLSIYVQFNDKCLVNKNLYALGGTPDKTGHLIASQGPLTTQYTRTLLLSHP
jgi:hypothetical protein